MKTKRLPDDYCDWIKAQTFVIGAETVFEHGLRGFFNSLPSGPLYSRKPRPMPRFRHTRHGDLNPVKEMMLNPYKYPYDPKARVAAAAVRNQRIYRRRQKLPESELWLFAELVAPA